MLPAASHLARAAVLTIAVVGAVLGPCVPGSYDPLALPLSMVARCASWALLLFVPIGAAWWVRDVIVGLPLAARALGVVTVGAATLVSVVVVIAAAAFGGAMLAAACAATAVVMLRHRAARWTAAAATMETGALALLYLVIVPGLVFILQRQLFEPAVDANRARLIAAAGPLMTQIEEHRARRGAYPESLLSVTTDYRPRSRSVSRFWYERAGAAYNLAFEQPPAALDMREFVVFNPSGRAVLTSHDSDLMSYDGDDLERRRGFPSSADVPGHPGWRVFRFD